MSMVRIGESLVGDGQPCFIGAEIGINHNGDIDLAKQMIDAAAEAGADSVKFQNYRTEDFVSDRTLTYEYISKGRKIVESQYDMFKRCELKRDVLAELKAYCDGQGILFHSTPTSAEGLADLVAMGVAVLKNGSDFLGNLPLIRAMGESGLPTVLSTGMGTPDEIETAVETFCSTGNNRLVLLHCVSVYPTPPESVHLRKLWTLAQTFQCLAGFSDHTEGVEAALGAVALGACWIEKHFTLDKSLPGPDHRFSADPCEIKALVDGVRRMELYLGDGRLGYCAAEQYGRDHFRLSCVAARDLAAGHRVCEDDIIFRRPSTGLPPKDAERLVGKTLKCDVRAGLPLKMEHLV